MNERIYLDHNATTPVRPEVVAAVATALERPGNPSSVHGFGRAARRTVEDARERVAALVGAQPADVVFTSGGTEANALALQATGRARVLASAVEHVSVLQANAAIARIAVDTDGVVALDELATLLASSDAPALVSVMLANNETGVIQPVAEVAALAHRHGALVHCDAVQAVGKVSVDVGALGVDLLSISAHKLGGPSGIGALVVLPHVPFASQLRGGGQERGRRAGSENLCGIAGFGAAAEAAAGGSDRSRIERLRDTLERRLRAACPAAPILAQAATRLPNTACIAMPGVAAETQVIAFDLAGIAVSAGAACSSGKVAASHVLAAMGVGEDIARETIRVSLGWTSREADIERFLEVWTGLYARTRAGGAEGVRRPVMATAH